MLLIQLPNIRAESFAGDGNCQSIPFHERWHVGYEWPCKWKLCTLLGTSTSWISVEFAKKSAVLVVSVWNSQKNLHETASYYNFKNYCVKTYRNSSTTTVMDSSSIGWRTSGRRWQAPLLVAFMPELATMWRWMMRNLRWLRTWRRYQNITAHCYYILWSVPTYEVSSHFIWYCKK